MKFKQFIKESVSDFKKVPSWLVALSVVTTVLMNLLANKSLIATDWWTGDCGIVVSWVMFLVMDIVTQRYGGKASFAVTMFDVAVALLMGGLMAGVAAVPESNISGWFYGPEASQALNNVIGNNYLVLLVSLFAFICASCVDILMNVTIGKAFQKTKTFANDTNKRGVKGFFIYFCRAYASTFVSQFVDNFVFASIAVPLLFKYPCNIWSLAVGAFLGAITELIIELIFAPIGYAAICKKEKEQ